MVYSSLPRSGIIRTRGRRCLRNAVSHMLVDLLGVLDSKLFLSADPISSKKETNVRTPGIRTLEWNLWQDVQKTGGNGHKDTLS